MIKTYLFLAGAVFCEVAGTMLLPVSQNFTKLVPTAALSFFYLCAFYLLTFVVNKLPIAIVYATWSGLGIFTIAIMGYIFFKQKTAYEIRLSLVGSEMCIRDSYKTNPNSCSFIFLSLCILSFNFCG